MHLRPEGNHSYRRKPTALIEEALSFFIHIFPLIEKQVHKLKRGLHQVSSLGVKKTFLVALIGFFFLFCFFESGWDKQCGDWTTRETLTEWIKSRNHHQKNFFFFLNNFLRLNT